jgi:hypothetical protein
MKHRVNWHLDMGPGKQFDEGDVIDLTPEKAAELEHFGVVTPLEAETEAVAEIDAAELKKMSKEQLAEYAQKKFSKVLDYADMTKGQMLAAIAELG